MNNSKITIIISILAVVLAGSVKVSGEHLKVGFARRIVNPKAPAVPIGHVSKTPRGNIHCDLRVQAMVAQAESGKGIVWMGWDFCYVRSPLAERVKKMVAKKYGIAPEAFCINASHTHSAPPLTEPEAVKPEYFDADYAEYVVEQAVAVVGDAIDKLTPAKLRYCEQLCTSVGINRRKDVNGTIEMLPNFNGIVDHRVQVIAAESPTDNKLIGVIVKYACHPVTVGPAGLGSDYPGFMREFIETRHPGAVVVFMQGCGADVRIQIVDKYATKFIRESEEQIAARFGRDLGMSVEWALAKEGMAITGPIEYGYKVIELPLEKVPESKYRKEIENDTYRRPWAEKHLAMLERGETIAQTEPYRMQVFRFGRKSDYPFMLMALQGEVFTEYGFNLAERLKPANIITLGYSNHMAGYVCTAEAIKEGGYEPQAHGKWKAGPYTTAIEDIILDTATKLAQSKGK